jgi:hypothetical protein
LPHHQRQEAKRLTPYRKWGRQQSSHPCGPERQSVGLPGAAEVLDSAQADDFPLADRGDARAKLLDAVVVGKTGPGPPIVHLGDVQARAVGRQLHERRAIHPEVFPELAQAAAHLFVNALGRSCHQTCR